MLKWLFSKKKPQSLSLLAPLSGEVLPLEEVPDPVFAQNLAGEGVAILPADGTLVSPVDGVVLHMFETGHAVGLRSREGLEILLHIGIDTVNLRGRGFHPLVKDGDEVKAGDVLIRFDPNVIVEAGLSLISPVVITNRSVLEACSGRTGTSVRAGVDPVMDIQLRPGE